LRISEYTTLNKSSDERSITFKTIEQFFKIAEPQLVD